MGGPMKYIEGVKTALIVALFLSAMLLLYFFWENPTLPTFDFSEIIVDEREPVPTAEEIIQPEEITINFGSGVSTVISYQVQNSWNQGLLALRKFGNAEDLKLETITKEQYQMIMGYRSVSFSFLYTIPFQSFSEEYGITKGQNLSQIQDFNVLSYSVGSPESLFLVDETAEKYYRMVSEQNKNLLEPLIASVEQEEYLSYYPIGTFLGTSNQTVMPLAYQTRMEELSYLHEFDRTDEAAIRKFAQKFFGESFDFVRRLEESKGTLIYMYGYGQKVLSIYQDGSIEYKEESTTSGSEQSYFEALNSVLQFVSTHGSWEPFDETKLSPFLRYSQSISVKETKKAGYRFVFGIKAGEEDVFYGDSEILTVEILNGQITSYKRDLIKAILPEDLSYSSEKETFSPINMLAENYTYLYALLLSEGYVFKEAEGEALFDEVSELIDQVRQGYIRQAPSESVDGKLLQPVWVVMIDDIEVYFDLFEATPLGYTNIGVK